MHCSNCGTELPDNAKFCPECGAEFAIPIEKPVQQSLPPRRAAPAQAPQASIPSRQVQPTGVQEDNTQTNAAYVARRARRARKASASRVIISLILIFAVIGSAMAVITLTTWGSYKGDAQYKYAPASIPTKDAWSFSTDSANLNIVYTTNASAPEIQVAVHYDFAGAFIKGKTAADLYTLTFDNASKQFSLARKDILTFAMIDNSSVFVTLNPAVTFNITASVASGNLVMMIPDGIKAGSLSLTASSGNNHLVIGSNATIEGTVNVVTISGNVDFTSGNSTYAKAMAFRATSGNVGVTLFRVNASGNIVANATSGNVNVNIANMTLGANIRLDVGVLSGNINLVVDQRANPAKNVSCYLGTASGNVVVNYKAMSSQSSAKFTSTKVSGNIYCTDNGGFSKPSGDCSIFQSNQGKPCNFDAKLNTVSGNIRITGQMF